MDNEKIVIELSSGKMAILTLQKFDNELNVDDILRIDYGNIMGEILTFPLIFNRIANLKAEMGEILSQSRLDVRIFESQLREECRKSLLSKSSSRVTESQVESGIHLDPKYRAKKEYHYRIERNYEYLESLYWSAQSKDKKLSILTEKMRPEDFERELVEDTINGVMIKITQPAIK